MSSLDTLARQYNTDKSSLYHNYTRLYAHYFEKYRNQAITFLEIGVLKGDSIKMWLDYFPSATIIGLDINVMLNHIIPESSGRLILVQGDQEDAKCLQKLGETYGPFDIIVDDGGHTMKGQQISLQILFPFLKPNGIYAVEDLHTCFMAPERFHRDQYPSTFTFLQDRVLDLQWHGKAIDPEVFYADFDNHLKTFGNSPPALNNWEQTLDFVHFYRSLVFLGKRPHPPSHTPTVSKLQTLYLDTLAKSLVDYYYQPINIQTGELATEFDLQHGTIWPDRAVTMIGLRALKNIQDCVTTILQEGIVGDLVEAGVWKGGAAMFMRAVLQAYGDDTRAVYICDSFEGLPPPDPQWAADQGDTHHTVKYLAVNLETVRHNFNRFGLQHSRNVFVKGWFRDTLTLLPTDQIALLRLDGDMYGSTIDTLTALYDKVTPGGFILIDDYGLTGCKKAVDDFRRLRNITNPIQVVTAYEKVFWRKDK